MNRVPAILLLVAMLVGLVIAERSIDPVRASAGSLTVGGPVAAVGPDEGSTWYCAAGFSTPDASNDESSTYLLNLWIPLQQVTNPLVFMDRRTLDQQRHQLRYGLPVEGFLERDEDERVNDIWKFLPDPRQEFWFRSDMGPDRAFVFDTLGTPHGAGRLAGEEALEVLFLVLDSACTSAAAGDTEALAELAGITAPDLPDATTDAIRAAHARMVEVLRRASTDDEWVTEARAAMDTVIRKSVEMRIVATVVD